MSTAANEERHGDEPARGALPDRVHASFEGEALSCAPGASVAAALISTGKSAWRDTRTGAKRGLFCGIGVCFDCLVEIDGESGQRACMIPLAEGMDVRRARGPQSATDHSHAGEQEETTA